MRPWYEVAVPRREIREGKFNESVFAANLATVEEDHAPVEYRDPVTFFRITYPTQGLKKLISSVFSRLSGRGGEAVIQIETPFGGGKTHSLIALYHFFKHGNELKETVSDYLGSDAWEMPKVRVVTFVGTTPAPLSGKTPWGEIAAQLGRYDIVKEHDIRRRATGTELLRQVIGDEPTLILMDELAEYLVKAKDFADQVLAFLHELTEVASSLPRCALVVTLPSSAPYLEGGEEALYHLRRIFGRVETIHTPVEGEELYEIIRRRLFESINDHQEVRRTAQEFFEMYQKLEDNVPSKAREVSYRDRTEKAYPFHPELIDVLFERWSTFPNFQRTRGVLRLLAQIVSDLYQRREPLPLILPSHVNLENPKIREELVGHIGNEYEGVIASDIAGPNAKAKRVDRALGSEYEHLGIASGIATAIFFGSFSNSERRGVTLQQIRFMVLRKEIPASIVGDALKRLEDELWYLHEENGLYSFSTQPNLNRIVLDKEGIVREEEVEREIRSFLERVVGKEFRVYPWPDSSADVPDTRELKLVVLHPAKDREKPEAIAFAKEMLKRAGSAFRTYQNTVLVLLADRNECQTLRQNVRKLLALRAIERDSGIFQRLSKEKKEDLAGRIKSLSEDIPFHVLSTYRYLARASGEDLDILNLGILTIGERNTLGKRVIEHLKREELFVEKVTPNFILEKVLTEEKREISLRDLVDAFLRYPNLPVIANEDVVYNAVREGVRNGAFGLLVEDQVYFQRDVPEQVLKRDDAKVVRRELVPSPTDRQPRTDKEPVIKGPETSKEPARPLVEPGKPPIEVLQTTAPKREYSRVRYKVELPSGKFSDFVRGVIIPLQNTGAEVKVILEVQATATEGKIQESIVEEKVKETLHQIGAKIIEERLE